MKTMKKILVAVLALALMLACVACGSKAEEPQSEDSLKLALVMDGSINDGGWYADCYAGGVAAQEKFGYELAYSENLEQADFVTAVREYAADGYDLVILSGNNFEDAVAQVYEEFPDTHFAGINFYMSADNVTAMGYNNYQAGFLGGAFAALCSETGVVGFIGGTDMTPTMNGASGFEQGAKYVNPDAEAVVSMCGSWNDAAKGKELAISQATTSNVDVIYGWAGSCNQGIFAGCEETGIHGIAEPLDSLDAYPNALFGSVIVSNEALIVDVAEKVAAGGYVGEVSISGAPLMSFGKFNDAVPEGVADELEQIRQGLISGEITLVEE